MKEFLEKSINPKLNTEVKEQSIARDGFTKIKVIIACVKLKADVVLKLTTSVPFTPRATWL
jgi:hypothetical protein